MNSKTIKTIGVVGAGQMGSGIVQVFAVTGYGIILQDIQEEYCQRGLATIQKSLEKFSSKGKITVEEQNAALARIKTTTNLEDLSAADFIIEAATEDEKLKLEIFKKLSAVVKPSVILATNTSSISITKIASATSRPQLVIGMHFMNPVPLMKGVEVIRGAKTSAETISTVSDLIRQLGKIEARSNDAPGFIANRVLMPMINEAAYALHEGVASREDIDSCLVNCCNFPLGPLALADLIGLDTVVAILKVLHQGFSDPKYLACPLLTDYVAKGQLGRKTKKGFYEY